MNEPKPWAVAKRDRAFRTQKLAAETDEDAGQLTSPSYGQWPSGAELFGRQSSLLK